MTSPRLSVIIPAYNGEKNLQAGVLEEVASYLEAQNYSYEVLIVDDGSTDGTASVIEQQIKNKKNFQLIRNPHKGKAVAVMTGLLKSKGEIAVFTDLDQSTPPLEIEKFFPKFDQGYDIVVGSRQGRAGSPVIRKLASWTFSFLRNVILGLPLSDTQCGFKAFNRKSIDLIFPKLLEKWQDTQVKGRAVNAGFDIETLFTAKKKKLKISEVKVRWQHVGTEKEHLLKDAVEALQVMLQIKLGELSGKYG